MKVQRQIKREKSGPECAMRISVRTSLACIAQAVRVQLHMLEFEDRIRLYIAHCEGYHLVRNVPLMIKCRFSVATFSSSYASALLFSHKKDNFIFNV